MRYNQAVSKEFWLKNKSMQGGWFYAKSLEKWVSAAPMKVTDVGVREAAIRQGIELWWDDEGRIARLNFYEAKKLLAELGLEMLSPTEYWRALQDAKNADNQLMVTELTSNRYAEWLDVLFFQNNDRYFMVSHPTIKAGRWKKSSDQEKAVEINMPKGRYGWLKFGGADSVFEVIDSIHGFPVEGKVLKNRPRKGMIFKYWDIFDGAPIKGAIRGYVTSSGTPSLDCAMPLTVADAPLLMVRACRKELPESERDLTMIKMLENIGQLYDELMRKKKYADFYKQKGNLLRTISLLSSETVEAIRKSRENNFIKIREKLADMLGMVYLYADRVRDNDGRREVLFLGKSLFGVTKDKISDASFTEFVLSSVKRVRASLKNQKPVVFVMGHKSPDTDTVISALFEAYRNQLINSHVEYVPVVQGDTLPDEVMVLLNNSVLSESILLSTNRVYDRAVKFGQVTWVLVDHNVSEVQKFVVSILDHHAPSEVALRQDVAKTIEIVGSTAGMVVTRFWGMGLPLEKEMARVCYGATLMDTENRSRYKMTLKDEIVMQKLEDVVGKVFGFYSKLMDSLLRTADADLLFSRDYKEDWGFGFAVAKVKGVFARPGGEVVGREILTRLVALAGQNNVRKNLPLTMVKVVDYEVDNETVFKERMYFIFGSGASDQFKEEVFKIFAIILENEFQSTKLEILQKNIYTEWLGVGKQLSRKKIAPVLLPVVKTFNEYFYSEKVKMYVSRDFLKKTKKIDDIAHRLGIALSTNEDGYVNFLTPLEIFLLTEELGFAVPTLKEYAMIRSEAKLRKDEQMVSSLESHRFVEVLGTVILKYGAKANETKVVEHPSVIRDREGKLKIRGKGRIMSVPRAEPGLIVWDEVDPKTGLPEKVFYPGKDQIDENTVYSRYWSPEIGEQCVFTRGSIFIYKITCMDGKVRLDETHPNLGVRVCRTSLSKPLIITSIQKGVVLTDIINDGVMLSYKNGVLLEEKDAPFEDITDRVYKELLVVDKKNHALELEPYLAGVVPTMFRESLSKSAIGEVQIHYGPATFVEKVNPRLFVVIWIFQ